MLTVVAGAGVWQAAILGIFAAARLKGAPGLLLLGALGALAHVQATLAAHATGQAATFPLEMMLTAAAVGMTIGPLVYLAVRTWLYPSRGWRATDALHFAPALIQLIVQLPVLVMGSARTALLDDYIGLGLVQSFLPSVELPRLIGVIYLGLVAWRVLDAARDPARRAAVPVAVFIAAGYGAVFLAMVFIFSTDAHAWLRPVLVSGVLLALHLGALVRLPALCSAPEDAPAAAPMTTLASGDGHRAAAPPEIRVVVDSLMQDLLVPAHGANRYKRSRLSKQQKATLHRRLSALMEEERAYTDPALTLEKVGERLGTLPRYVSQVVNETMDQSFTAFVNGYRVAAAQRRLQDPACEHLTVVAVGEEAGFASKSAFYEAFKRVTGTTPASYRAQPPQDAVV